MQYRPQQPYDYEDEADNKSQSDKKAREAGEQPHPEYDNENNTNY